MSIEQQIRPNATKVPHAEIVRCSTNAIWADVRKFEGVYGAPRGDALTALCTTAYCREGWIRNPDIKLHHMVTNIGKILNLIAPSERHSGYRSDTVIIGHGPLGERAGGLPAIGIDNSYQGWLNTTENDGEITILSTLPQETLERAILLAIKKFKFLDESMRGTTHNTEIKSSDWINPVWNINNSQNLPKINRYIRTSYTYWGTKEFPAFDFHTISGINAVEEFLTIYGDIYSNVFGLRFLACFIDKKGNLEQRIWQPIKPEKGPKSHVVKLTFPEKMFDLFWCVPEAIRLARETVRIPIATRQNDISIDPLLIEPLRTALINQSKIARYSMGQDWINKYVGARYRTSLYRANLINPNNGINKVNNELQKIGWFEATKIQQLNSI